MVRVMDFAEEVGNRQLQLVGPQPAVLVPWRKLMPVAEKEQNVRCLSYDSPASLEERGSERQLAAFPTVKKAHQPRHAESLTCSRVLRRGTRCKTPQERGARTRLFPGLSASNKARTSFGLQRTPRSPAWGFLVREAELLNGSERSAHPWH